MSGRFRYAAFLRGVNMIGRRTVDMADLRRILESIDVQDVTTVLSSGNVTFVTRRTNVAGCRE